MDARKGTDRRKADRGGSDRRVTDRILENAERISALLTFVPYVTTAAEADSRRAEADKLAAENTALAATLV